MPVPRPKRPGSLSKTFSVTTGKPQGRPVRLETDTRILRSLRPSDAGRTMAAWFEDPVVLAGLNLPAGGITQQNLKGYIEEFDNRRKFIIGIFIKPDERYVGFYQVDVNVGHKVAQLSVAVGDQQFRGLPSSSELSDLIVGEFFERRGVEKFVARVLASNYKALWAMKNSGFEFEAVLREDNLLPSGERVDIAQFRYLKSKWQG
ncbi:MAG: GNAT family protein [Pseudomonadota bacterium]